jgi:hypothetical protein
LAALPWKFLYSPERHLFLAASVETPLSRYLNLGQTFLEIKEGREAILAALREVQASFQIVAKKD